MLIPGQNVALMHAQSNESSHLFCLVCAYHNESCSYHNRRHQYLTFIYTTLTMPLYLLCPKISSKYSYILYTRAMYDYTANNINFGFDYAVKPSTNID